MDSNIVPSNMQYYQVLVTNRQIMMNQYWKVSISRATMKECLFEVPPAFILPVSRFPAWRFGCFAYIFSCFLGPALGKTLPRHSTPQWHRQSNCLEHKFCMSLIHHIYKYTSWSSWIHHWQIHLPNLHQTVGSQVERIRQPRHWSERHVHAPSMHSAFRQSSETGGCVLVNYQSYQI